MNFRYLAVVIVLSAALALVGVLAIKGCLKPGPAPVGPTTVGQVYTQVPASGSISLAPTDVPTGHKASEYRGKLTVTVKPPAGTDAPMRPPETIEVLIPKKGPPEVRATPGDTVKVSYVPISKPWLRWAPGVLVGVSMGESGRVSPEIGLAAPEAFQRLDLGIGASREGIGATVGWIFHPRLEAVGQWNAIRFSNGGRIGLGICYRF